MENNFLFTQDYDQEQNNKLELENIWHETQRCIQLSNLSTWREASIRELEVYKERLRELTLKDLILTSEIMEAQTTYGKIMLLIDREDDYIKKLHAMFAKSKSLSQERNRKIEEKAVEGKHLFENPQEGSKKMLEWQHIGKIRNMQIFMNARLAYNKAKSHIQKEKIIKRYGKEVVQAYI